MLRKTVIIKIYNALDRSAFSPADFVIDFPEAGEVLVSIRFRYDNNFLFELKERWDKERRVPRFFTIEAPGEHKVQEAVAIVEPSSAASWVMTWCSNIRSELRASIPVYDDLDHIREMIEKHIQEHVKHPEEPFSEAEIDALREKLDNLTEKFDELQQQNELTEQEVNRLKREIRSVKSDLAGFPKECLINS